MWSTDDAHAGGAAPLDSRVTLAVLRQLATLETAGSLSAVARVLGVSQPTVSANLSRLESVLGFPLVLRSTTGTRLTREGIEVAAAAKRLLETSDDLARTIAALPATSTGPLRIAASLTIAEQLVPRWLADPRIAGPIAPGQARLSVGNSEEVMGWISLGRADIGFVEGNTIRAGLDHRHVGSDELVIVVGPSHEWSTRREPLAPAELIRGGLVVRERGSGTLEVLEDALQRLGLALPDLPSFASTSAILTAVRHGGAVAVVSRLAADPDLVDGRLVAVDVRGLALTRRLSAVWSRDTPQRADAAALITNIATHWAASAAR